MLATVTDGNDDVNDYCSAAEYSIDADAYDSVCRIRWRVRVFRMLTICDRAAAVAPELDDGFDAPSMEMALAADDVFAVDDENWDDGHAANTPIRWSPTTFVSGPDALNSDASQNVISVFLGHVRAVRLKRKKVKSE